MKEEDTFKKIFGIEIAEAYELSKDDKILLVKDKTNYLDEIYIEEIKDIRFSYPSHVIVLLFNKKLYLNGRVIYDDIESLIWFGINIFAITKDRVIRYVFKDNDAEFLNDNNYKYKKIVYDVLGLAALRYDKVLRYYGYFDSVVDYEKFINVDDIGLLYNDEDKFGTIVIVQGDVVKELGYTRTFENNDDVILSGSGDQWGIIE